VAVITGVAAGNVGCGLTFCDCAVVTRATCTQHGIVVDSRDILKARGRMAIFTDIRGVNVGGVFAGGVHAIVAG
jgi:hypothetical protein